jgi:hypothetical protein
MDFPFTARPFYNAARVRGNACANDHGRVNSHNVGEGV